MSCALRVIVGYVPACKFFVLMNVKFAFRAGHLQAIMQSILLVEEMKVRFSGAQVRNYITRILLRHVNSLTFLQHCKTVFYKNLQAVT